MTDSPDCRTRFSAPNTRAELRWPSAAIALEEAEPHVRTKIARSLVVGTRKGTPSIQFDPADHGAVQREAAVARARPSLRQPGDRWRPGRGRGRPMALRPHLSMGLPFRGDLRWRRNATNPGEFGPGKMRGMRRPNRHGKPRSGLPDCQRAHSEESLYPVFPAVKIGDRGR